MWFGEVKEVIYDVTKNLEKILVFRPKTTSKLYINAIKYYFGALPPVRIDIVNKKIKRYITIVVTKEIPQNLVYIVEDKNLNKPMIMLLNKSYKGSEILGSYDFFTDTLILKKELFYLYKRRGKKKIYISPDAFAHEAAHLLVLQPFMSLSYLLTLNKNQAVELYKQTVIQLFRLNMEKIGVVDELTKLRKEDVWSIELAGGIAAGIASFAVGNLLKTHEKDRGFLKTIEDYVGYFKERLDKGKHTYINTKDKVLRRLSDYWFKRIKKKLDSILSNDIDDNTRSSPRIFQKRGKEDHYR